MSTIQMGKRILFFYSCLLIMLASCKHDFDIHSCLAKKYTYQELEFFYQSGFYDQKKIKKWRSDIKVSFEGELTKTDIANLDSLIMEFLPLISPIKIERVEENANVKFFFTKIFKGRKMTAFGQAVRKPKGWFSGNEISACDIWINPVFSELSKRNTMRHEFMHALGMEHPLLAGQQYKSIDEHERMSGVYRKIDGLDKTCVKILYDECMPAGLTKEEFKRQLDQLKKK